ncbi:MAG: tripartite tricarboxylate transporter substrate binding protein, partial [Gemmatimonadaceae bacterium]|nr:tripartite tricarboxylate transporter substrate binding protein [Gemmatimonadaceae bacterium]
MSFATRRVCAGLGILCVLPGLAAAAQPAADYPARPLRMVVPFAPGGSADTTARIIAQKMTENWGRQVVVDNRTGANGVIGMEIAARAAPDGYTLVLGYIANLGTALALNPRLPYDPIKDFAPISHIVSAPSIAVVHPGVPAKTLQELLALARAKPGAIPYGTAAVGAMGHLTGELLNRLANVKMQHVPYKGGAQAVIDVLAGQIPLVIIGMSAVTPHVKTGRLRPIATTGAKRSFAFPDVPTVAEQGFPGFSAEAWYGLLGPAGIPRPIVDKLNAEVVRITRLADARERFAHVGFEVYGSSPDEFLQLIREEIPRWNKVVKDAGI